MNKERWAEALRAARCEDEMAPLDRLETMPECGGPWLVRYDLERRDAAAWRASLATRPWTLWRYFELLPVGGSGPRVDLGEGGTPLVPLRRLGGSAQVYLKDESRNPTGSFKDRGLALAVHRATELGVAGVELASAGNAGIALSAYAAAHGVPARVAIPEDTPEAVRRRCQAFGAEVIQAPGTLVDARVRLREMDRGFFDVSTFREPYRVEGKKTMGLEVAEQLGWAAPDWIVYPTGGGTGIVAMAKAFDELAALGLVDGPRPRFVVVQMEGCAPIARAWAEGTETARVWEDPETRAWGLRVPASVADREILSVLRDTDGRAETVGEADAEDMRRRLAEEEGLLAGPEGAASMAATRRMLDAGIIQPEETVVVFQTGHPANYGLV